MLINLIYNNKKIDFENNLNIKENNNIYCENNLKIKENNNI